MNLAEAIYYQFYLRRRRKFERPESRRAAQELRRQLSCKIISVGNITTGGTGKTPAVQWTARWLQARGLRVAVVARGYGARLSATGAVVSDGERVLLGAEDGGDEPVLHARALPGVPVVIGRDRVAAARTAVERFSVDVLVLDDAFQYWSLPRDLDLVLLDARQPFGNGQLLPTGRLREPLAALRRADVVVLTRADLATPHLRRRVREGVLAHAPVFEAMHAPVRLRDEASGSSQDLTALQSVQVATVSALADNDDFVATVTSCGATVVARLERRDHHVWRERDLREFAQTAARAGAIALVTTEKDAVKIRPEWLGALPLWSIGIELRILEGEIQLQQCLARRLGLSDDKPAT